MKRIHEQDGADVLQKGRPQETRDYLIRMLDIHSLKLTGGIGQHLMRAWPTSY
mgnify:CR=1 FL=1